MKPFTWIGSIMLIIPIAISSIIYFYQLYNPKQPSSKWQANPYLYDRQYYNPSSEEEAKHIIDELTNHDQSYDEQFYINQVQYYGSVFAREFIHDKTDEIIKKVNNKDFVRMKTPTGYGYCKDEVLIEFGIKEGYSQQKGKFVIEVSWDIDNACRKYWWGGKNPRALRKE